MSGGLAYRSINGEWTVYNQDNSELPDNWINALESDGSGGLWIGTGYILDISDLTYRSVSGEWTVYNQDNSELPSDRINALESDGNSGLWIGSHESGLTYRSASGEWIGR